MSDLEHFRQEKDHFFNSDPHSPLTAAQKLVFQGNECYSCPLTPAENRLKVPIRAGEKLPKGDWAA